MTDTYKATPECWEWQEKWASKEVPDEDSSCFLELRARVEALEAQASNYPAIPDSSTPPTVATDEELLKIWNSEKGCRPWVSRRAIYNLGIEHGQASSPEVAAPAPVAGGLVKELVDRVSNAIMSVEDDDDDDDDPSFKYTSAAIGLGMDVNSLQARAAILEVAKWLYERSWNLPADLLKQEAGR